MSKERRKYPRWANVRIIVTLLTSLIAWLVIDIDHGSCYGQQPMVQLTLNGVVTQGTPVTWSSQQVLLLERNGHLLNFAPAEAREFQKLPTSFRPFSQSEMRGRLMRAFGRGFEVSGTGNYLVVHPTGQRDQWAPRFEALYRSFVQYFAVRGMRTQSPEFPLVAVVFPSRAELARYVRGTGDRLPPGIVGFYSMASNQIMLYDVTRGKPDDANWHLNAETIIHEATHQLAFNTRVHSRFATPPRWAAEGLAMLFEAPGVWDARHYPNLQDRVNPSRLAAFQQYLPTRPRNGHLAQFVSQPAQVFMSNPRAAYAEAWALSFFLSEKEPSRYVTYLARTAAREPLRRYTPSEQLDEFTRVFGTKLAMLDARFLRFIGQLGQNAR